jgi:hypothetical protein
VRDLKVVDSAAFFFWIEYPCVYDTLGQEAPMPDSLPELESRRAELVKQFARLGDLRSGSISNTSGRCGKPNCHCHQPGQPVHGPNPRLTFKVEGKTVTESLPTSAAQKKAEREIGEFRRFEQLLREFIAVNAKICQARSAEDQPVSQEKKRLRRLARKPRSS